MSISGNKSAKLSHLVTDGLGIGDLPEHCARLMPSKMYALSAELFEHRRALIQQLTSGHRKLIIISKMDPAKLLQGNSEPQRDFATKVAKGSVVIFHLQRSRFGKVGSRAVRRLIAELSYYVKAKNALIVLENGSEMLGVGDTVNVSKHLDLWQDWLRNNRNTLLFLLSEIHSDPLILNNIRFIQDRLAGLAVLSADAQWISLAVQHWYSSHGIVAGQQFDIVTDGLGYMKAQVGVAQVVEAKTRVSAVDTESVWTLMPVVKNEEVPESWSVSEHYQELEDLSASAVSGTIVLPYLNSTVMEELARLVYALRLSRGKRIKIVIRELSARMRHSEERLFRHLGATLVAPMEVGFSRLLGMIESVRDLEFEGTLSDDFEQAFILANPERKLGYLAPAVFVNHVQDLLEQSRSFGIKYAFIKLKIFPAMKVREVLKICQIRRPGDICTADKKHLYLFLFGCRETDISKALQFIFNMPVAQLFDTEERNTNIDNTLLAIEELDTVVQSKSLTDHTEWLKNHQQALQKAKPTRGGVFQYHHTSDHIVKHEPVAAIRQPLLVKREAGEVGKSN